MDKYITTYAVFAKNQNGVEEMCSNPRATSYAAEQEFDRNMTLADYKGIDPKTKTLKKCDSVVISRVWEPFVAGAVIPENSIEKTSKSVKQYSTEFAVLGKSTKTGDLVVCTSIFDNPTDAKKQFEEHVNNGKLNYIEPDSGVTHQRQVVTISKQWEVYKRFEIMDLLKA